MWRELSARIGGSGLLVLLDFADHAVQVGEDLPVHLGHPGLPLALGDLDEGERAVALLAQLGQELRAGDENRTRQTRIRVGTRALDG
jgi:hypothetical protein